MFQKHKRESSPDSIGEPINEEELIEVQMKQRHPQVVIGGKSSNSLDYNSCDMPSASAGHKSSAAVSPSSTSAAPAAATSAAGGSNAGGGGSTSVGGTKPNSNTSSVVVNLPASYPNSELDYGSASYPPSPSLSSNNDKPQVRITFL